MWQQDCFEEISSNSFEASLNHINNGYYDWYLPSAEEALLIPSVVETQQNSYLIWTSTEVDKDHAYMLELVNGELVVMDKSTQANVYAIRYFNP